MPRSSSRPTRAQLLEENAALRAQIAHLENAAPAREDAYRVLFENAPVAISRSAPDGTLLEVNPAFAQLFGYATPQAFLAAGLTGAQLYADPGTRARLFAAVRDRADILRAEVQYRRPDGTEFPGQVTVRAVRDAAGQIAHLEGFIEDITDRWQAEEALRASEAALRALFDAAGDALFLLAVDETVRAVNHSGAAWLGRPPVAIIGQPFTRLLTAEARAYFQPHLAQALAGRAARFESGSAEQWYDHSLCPVLDGSGAVTGVAILAHDLTERRRIEAELRRSEQIHRSFIEHSSDGCILTDEHGRVQEWNPASERLTGLPREAVLGQPSWEVQARLMPAVFQSPASIASLRTAMQDVLRTGQAPFLGQALERPFQRADGEARFVRQMAFAIPTAAGYWLGSTTSDITERQRAEAALRESETQYRLLFDHLHEGFALHAVITNAEGQVVDFRILDANQAYERHTGRQPAEVIGRTMLELYPATEPAMIARYGAVAVDGEPRTWEYFSEVYQRYLRVHAFSPQPGYFATTFEDITASKQTEARLRRFWDLPLIGMAITSPDRRILEVNHKGAEMLGYTPAELAGASWVDLSHPDDVAENTRLLAQTLAGATDEYQMDKRFFRKDGALLYAHIAARCIRRADGVVDHLALIIEDVTDRQRAEERLRLHSAALESAANAIVITDRAGAITWINPAWSRLTGYTLAEVLGQNPRVLKSGRQDQAYYARMWDTILAGQVWESELVNRRKDGTLYTERQTITPVRDALGVITHFVGIKDDITERRQAEERLKASLAEKEILVKEIHHRVKNNLQVVISLLSLQADHIQDPHAQNVFQVSQERVRSIALVHEQLYQSPDLARIDFGDYLRTLTLSLQQLFAAGRPVRVTVDAPPTRLGVDTAIPAGLMVNDLVTNALKYAFPAGRAGQVRVTLTAEPVPEGAARRFHLAVSDDGVGLPADLDPGQTRSLGLQLVKILTRQINGELTVTRAGGAAFEIRFGERQERGI